MLTAHGPGSGLGSTGIVGYVDVRLLGSLRVLSSDGDDIEIPGTRLKGLIALLALEAPAVVSGDRIMDSLWGEEGSSKSALHAAISRVRSTLGEMSVETQPGGYRLGIPVANTDIERFRRHSKRGRQLLTLGQPSSAAEAFRQALAQWQGEVLADLGDLEFANQTRVQLDEERLNAVEWLMEAELATGNHELIIGELSGLVDRFPFRERLWGHLMTALYRSGRQAEALRTFTRLKQVLGDELGIEPSIDLADLEERILLHDPALLDTLDATSAASFIGEAEMLTYSPGDVIVDEGQSSGMVYWIEEGRVAVVKSTSDGGETILTELGPGRYFGELASLLGTGRTAGIRAITAVTVSLYTVEGFRGRLGAERAKDAAAQVPIEEVRGLVRTGHFLNAYDLASAAVERGSADPEMRFLGVLALARSGATVQARRRYESFGLHKMDPATIPNRLAEDIAALAARLDKDMAVKHGGEERAMWARRSAEGYRRAYERGGTPYVASNAATMYLLAGDEEAAVDLARRALEGIRDPATLVGDDRYWEAATEAEAALTLGDVDRAVEALARAADAGSDLHGPRAATKRQLERICGIRGIDPGILSPITNPTVAHYCGHRILPPGVEGRFPAGEEARVAAELKQAFETLGVGFGYGSLAAGADILAAEALLDQGARLSIQLPFDRDEFVRTSVATAGEGWVRRFERCLGEADRVEVVTRSEYLGDPVLFDFCARIAMGNSLLRASFLATEAHQVAVWDGLRSGGVAGTAADVETWAGAGLSATIISVSASESQAVPSDDAVRRIRALVFADFAGFSKLSDSQVLVFQEKVMRQVARALEPFRPSILHSNTWGDGVYLVFDDVVSAAECALAVQDAIATADLREMGLAAIRGLRIAAHATPVFDGWDPIVGGRVFFGAGVTEAARIEPRTPEGEIYTTRPFAALSMLAANRNYETQYVGTLPTAKDFGEIPLFALRRRI